MGNDSLRTLRSEVLCKAADVGAGDDRALSESLVDYRRFLFAAARVGDARQRLAPGAAVDLVWHAHQTNPLQYVCETKPPGSGTPQCSQR